MASMYPIEQMPGVELHAIFSRALLLQEGYQPHNPLPAKPLYRTENRDGLAGQNLHEAASGSLFVFWLTRAGHSSRQVVHRNPARHQTQDGLLRE